MTSCGVYLVALALCFQAAFALQCYSCDSSKSMACSFGLLSFSLPTENCNEITRDGQVLTGLSSLASFVPTECTKLVGVDRNGNEYVARGCTINGGVVNACQLMAKAMEFGGSQDFEKLDCWTCNSDLCNSATSISALGIILGIVAACLAYVF